MRVDENGLHIHQSDLKNQCLEKLRLDTVAVGPRMETDAATVGTVLHAAIEYELTTETFDSEFDARAWAAHHFLYMLEKYQEDGCGYSMATFGDMTRALASLDSLVISWYRSDERGILLATTQSPIVEWSFDLPFAEIPVKKPGKKAEIIPVYLAGTADIVWNNRVWDWKSAGSEYRQWEKQRWDRQPDVYTWAAHEAGLVVPDQDGLFTFEFKVFVRKSEPNTPQTVTVKRSPNHWLFLREIIGRLVNLIYNMGLDGEWPLNDQHVLCSPKWCSYFDMCKGKHVSGGTWL